MRNLFFFATLFFLFMQSFAVQAQSEEGIQFFHGTWSEALAEAKNTRKIIFVDAYASWCGPCKMMCARVFPEKKVGDYFNKHFVNLKIDMEKKENEEFAIKFPVGSYPTLMFIDENGKLLIKDIGAKQADALIELGKKALGSNNKSADLGKRYDAGERSAQFIHDYVVELNKAGKPSLKIVNDYLKTAKPEDQEMTKKIIFEGTTEADSKVFDLMTKDISDYRKMYGDEMVSERVMRACDATIEKAKAYKSEELLQEAKDKYLKFAQAKEPETFLLNTDLDYFKTVKNAEAYLALVEKQEKQLRKENKNNAIEKLIYDAMRAFPSNAQVLAFAEGAIKRMLKSEESAQNLYTLAEVQQQMGNLKEALKTAKKGKALADEKKEAGLSNKFLYFIQAVEEKI